MGTPQGTEELLSLLEGTNYRADGSDAGGEQVGSAFRWDPNDLPDEYGDEPPEEIEAALLLEDAPEELETAWYGVGVEWLNDLVTALISEGRARGKKGLALGLLVEVLSGTRDPQIRAYVDEALSHNEAKMEDEITIDPLTKAINALAEKRPDRSGMRFRGRKPTSGELVSNKTMKEAMTLLLQATKDSRIERPCHIRQRKGRRSRR